MGRPRFEMSTDTENQVSRSAGVRATAEHVRSLSLREPDV